MKTLFLYLYRGHPALRTLSTPETNIAHFSTWPCAHYLANRNTWKTRRAPLAIVIFRDGQENSH